MKVALLVVLSAGMCAGPQQPSDSHITAVVPFKSAPLISADSGVVLEMQSNGDVIAKPAPLKCGKYEHVEEICHKWSTVCALSTTGGCGCAEPTEKVCAPDLHTVTEKEWQELMSRLKRLEERNK